MSKPIPRIEIDLVKIQENSKLLVDIYKKGGVQIVGVTKAVSGDSFIATAMLDGGVQYLADSRIENIKKMKKENILSKFLLLRSVMSQAKQIVECCDVSLNSDLKILEKLSYFAKMKKINHNVIIMIELGDLREGVLLEEAVLFVEKLLLLPNLKLVGLGTNLSCLSGASPDALNMKRLSDLVQSIEDKFSIKIPVVSGGNSANYNWFVSSDGVGRINQLRVGESILLGTNPVDRSAIEGLHTQAFCLFGEVIEARVKGSLSSQNISQNAFGEVNLLVDRGLQKRIVVALGRQDVEVQGLICEKGLNIVGASSDHIVIEDCSGGYRTGDEVMFNLSYSGLISAMSSSYIKKVYIN